MLKSNDLIVGLMKKLIGCIFVFVFTISNHSFSQNNIVSLADRWEKVQEFSSKNLPESALAEIELIINQAKKENKSIEIIKALVVKTGLILQKNPNDAIASIKQFETFADKATDPAERALLHSMTAELYAQFYQKDQWTINQRTELKGNVPDDMKEWTKNIYFDKITKHLTASLENPEVLQKTDALKFAELIEKGKDSRELQPTLFDLLSYKRINLLTSLLDENSNYFTDETKSESDSTILMVDTAVVGVDTVAVDTLREPTNKFNYSHNNDFDSNISEMESKPSAFETQIRETYKQLIEFREKEGNSQAILYAKLQELIFDYKHSKSQDAEIIYLNKLDKLEKDYSDNEAVVEVLAYKANYYYTKSKDYRSLIITENITPNNTQNKLSEYRRKVFEICKVGISRFPKYKRIQLLENILKSITQKSFEAKHKEIVKPQSKLNLKIESSNLDSLKLSVYRVNATSLQFFKFKLNRGEKISVDYPDRTLIEIKFIKIKKDEDFGSSKTNFELNTKGFGIYEICLEDNNNKNEKAISYFTVTNLTCFSRSLNANSNDIYVTDRVTGQQQKDVKIMLYKTKWDNNGYKIDSLKSSKTNINGYCHFDVKTDDSNTALFLEKGQDAFFVSTINSGYYDFGTTEKELNKIDIFTDRSHYRPGQIVYFKGICYYSNKNQQAVVANKNYEISFFDSNNKKIDSNKLITNSFGSFSGEFVIPVGTLNGSCRIDAGNNNSVRIQVEEYKRPTFEVMLGKPKTEVNFGDKVTLNGIVTTFSGYNLGGTEVKYRITRRTSFYSNRYHQYNEEIASGTTFSKADGTFNITFIPEKQYNDNNKQSEQMYQYEISVDATDLKGETQQCNQSFTVSDISILIQADIEPRINKQQPANIKITTLTENDEIIDSKISYSLYQLAQTEKYDEELSSEEALGEIGVVLTGNFNTKDKLLNLNFSKFKSGRYKLVLKTFDKNGKEVKLEKTIILYSNNELTPPVKSYVWLQKIKTKCNVGENALVNFGTSTKNTAVLYELFQGNKILKSQWINFSNEIKTFNIPFLESYGTGITVMFTFIKNEELFTESIEISRQTEKKRLTPSLSVFRNKLSPGERAEWTIHIPESAKYKKTAELLVEMYDASLDVFGSHSWYFDPTFSDYFQTPTNWESYDFSTENIFITFDPNFLEFEDYQFNQINWFGLVKYYSKANTTFKKLARSNYSSSPNDQPSVRSSRSLDVTEISSLSALALAPPPELKSSIKFVAPIIKKDEEDQLNSDLKVGNGTSKNINLPENSKYFQLRTNFNETAFFYPQLRTDADGNVKFTFTAPESLTRWNVKMLAHTPDLYFGQGEAQVVTQKDLMVQMNLPRFVRRSDKLVLIANVINLTEKELNATVQFELINPATDKPIKLKDADPKSVILAANETKAVQWELTEFSAFELVTCKVIAHAGNFSDGEQKYLPVLPDKVLITESLPLTVRGNQTRSFNFERLLKNESSVDTKNLYVEFSSNPSWYAVQALPTLAVPESSNAIDYFTAYYVNSLATFIANSNPKLATTFDRWKKAGGSREALLSNLEKNTELKNMLLDETPWVAAAKNESEQKRQIALLFDLNNQKQQNTQYLDKLFKLQLPSGGFTWYEGMPESRYITQEIMLNFARLSRITNSDLLATYRQPLTAALNYLDMAIATDFDNLKKYNKNYQKEQSIDNMQLFYLHLRSEYPNVPIAEAALEAVKFYTAQAEKYWTSFTLYGEAMMAVVAQRNGKTGLAADILKSLKENALKTDEFGMYWARNNAGYLWNERPIAVQSAIIEAFAEISKNTADIDEMKIWLLKQKQTQRWDSPMATVEAIYALLHNGTSWLANEGKVEIKVGNTTLKPESSEAGTGYFKQSIPLASIQPSMGKVSVTKNDSGIGWGAMYWQFYQDLDKATGQSGPMKISKKLFVEKMTASGKTMIPIDQTKLLKGDKVITRLVITTDRNLEFVALKDLRASCFEPVNQRSGCQWKEGVCYYQTTKDASTQFFFSFLPKGTYVFEYELWVNNSGEFTSGIATIQCQYAPEFESHTGGERIKVAF